MSDKKCQVGTAGDFVCGRQAIRDEKCIFHLENKTDAEAKIFEKEFWAEFERMEKNNDIKELHFDDFIFPDPITFFSNIFEKAIFFTGAQFSKKANFCESIFKNEADFSEVQFDNEADFSEAKFSGKADFSRAEFDDEADFSRAEFDDEADFSGTEFSGEADFSRAEFIEEADFLEVQFGNRTHFTKAKFSGEADFSWVEFRKGAYFSQAIFNNKTNFYMSTFMDAVRFIFTEFNNDINFEYSQFYKPKNVWFHNIDLGNVSFINADISEVDFLNVTWREKQGRLTVVDESKIMKVETITYDAVAKLYRRLRWNYENNYKFAEAGDFFRGEMEMRRLIEMQGLDVTAIFKDEKVKTIELWFKRNFSLLSIYKHLSLYGESYWRPAILGLLVIVFYPATVDLYFRLRYNTPFFENLYAYPIRESFASFFQLHDTFLIERLIGLILLGLIFIALKRKFERKK